MADMTISPKSFVPVKHLGMDEIPQTIRDDWEYILDSDEREYDVRVFPLILTEIPVALDLDGGRATALYMIGEMETGRMISVSYYSGYCACFYGHVAAKDMGVQVGGRQATKDERQPVEIRARSHIAKIAIHTLLACGWRHSATPIEKALIRWDVVRGATHENNNFLSVLRDILLAYIAKYDRLNPAAQ